MKKVLILLSAVFLYGSLCGGTADLRGVVLKNIKIPIYNKNVLQVMAFADHAERKDRMMVSRSTFLDILLKDVNVDFIKDGWKEKLYSLDAPLQDVINFWQRRCMTSDAVFYTDKCNIDQAGGKANGSDPVFMRAPMLDINGLGFRCDFNSEVMEILADVHITARTANSDPRGIIAGKISRPVNYNVIRAKADSMRIDSEHDEIMLIGNVEVIDGQDKLTCDRLTLFLSGKNKSNTVPVKNNGNNNDAGATLKGVDRVLADGDVLLVRKPADTGMEIQEGRCEHLEYDVAAGTIVMTGEESNPVLSQGKNTSITGTRIELLRFSQNAFVRGSCRLESISTEGNETVRKSVTSDNADFDDITNLNTFTGNVKVTDKDIVITCRRMRVFMKNAVPGTEKKKKEQTSAAELSPVSGSKELDKVLFDGDLRIVTTSEDKSKKVKTTELTSKRGELNYSGNKLVFFENVHVIDGETTLDCDRLDLFLADKKANGKNDVNNVNIIPLAGNANGKNKTLTKVTAAGKTFMQDARSDLATEFMTLYFRDLPPGVKPSPGMFQSGGVQLIKITCDGSVVAHSKSNENKKQNSKTLFPGDAAKNKGNTLKCKHAISDMLSNRSEFHGKVSVHDGENLLTCRDMYVFTGQPPKSVQQAAQKAADDPDADPFALDMGENAAPSRIALNDGIDLQRIVCKNDVLLTNKDADGKIRQAGGDTGVYTVETRNIIITSNPPARPYMRSEGRIQYSDIIRGNLATEELSGIGNVRVLPDK